MMKQKKLITRKQYMDNEYSHDEYYGQWVTDQMISIVAMVIGKDRLLASTDKHLNDIPLRLWDNLPVMDYINKENWKDASLSTYSVETQKQRKFIYSPSDVVCIGKAAAREYIQSRNTETKKD